MNESNHQYDDRSDDDDDWVFENPGLTLKRHEEVIGLDDDNDDHLITVDHENVTNQNQEEKEEEENQVQQLTGQLETLQLVSTPTNKRNPEQPSDEAFTTSWRLDNQNQYTFDGGEWPSFSIPTSLYEVLYAHQRVGVQWMASLHMNGIGGILADDMGLGKTFTTLTYLGGLMRANTIANALVVAPVSVLRSWYKEAHKVLIQHKCVPQGLEIHIVASDMKRSNRQRLLRAALQSRHKPYLILSTYGLVARDALDYFTESCYFDYIVLDEAHQIKNTAAQVTKSCHRIARRHSRRILLTGTPIQNNLRELWALVDYATYGHVLGPLKRFLQRYGDVIELGRNKNASQITLDQAAKANQELQTLLQPHILQRFKQDILKDVLPPKREYVVWTRLAPPQRRLYHDYVQYNHAVKGVLSGELKSPLEAITWLKKLSGHVLLVDPQYDRQVSTLQRMSVTELLQQSAKLQILVDLVDQLCRKGGHKTLIFSQSTKLLDIVEHILSQQHYSILRIDGSVPESQRQDRVEQFNDAADSSQIMLLSTKAGGLGLTLTGADRAILYDPSWNPSDDRQAVDRCYRIGQTRPVEVYRLIAAGGVEEKMYEKQVFKDGLNRVVTTTSANIHRYFDKYELSRLFHLAPEGECSILQQLQQGESCTLNKFFQNHTGVLGVSSHDAIYAEQLPKNNNVSTPFATRGKAQRVLTRPALASMENTQPSPARFETVQGVVLSLRKEVRLEKALHYLLDLVENQGTLTKEQKLWMHRQTAEVSLELGWLN